MSEWKEYKLSDFIEINPKVTLKSGSKNSFVEMKDLSESQKFVLPSQLKDIKGGARFQNFDTLFARITPCLQNGKICQVKGLKNSIGFGSTEFLVFRGKEGISNTDFVYYLSRYDVVRKFAEQNMIGTSGRQRVSKDAFENIELLLPDLPTQTAITEILSSIDDKIELNNKINKELETLAQTLFKQWFIDFEFPNEIGEPYKSSGGEMVDSEFGEIPKDWKIGKIGDYIKFIKGKKPSEVFDTESENTLPQILIETLDTGKSMFARPEKMTICEKEDLIMVMDGASSGRIEIGFMGILGSTLAIIKSNGINNNLLYQFLKYKEKDIRNNTTGAAIPHTDKSKIFEYTISLPTENIVSNFSFIQENISKMIFSNKSELKSLTHLRDTLLPKLITGELNVNQINN